MDYLNMSAEDCARNIVTELIAKRRSGAQTGLIPQGHDVGRTAKFIEVVIDFGRNAVPVFKKPLINRGTSGDRIESKKYPGVYARVHMVMEHKGNKFRVTNLNQIGLYGAANSMFGFYQDPMMLGVVSHEIQKLVYRACETNLDKIRNMYGEERDKLVGQVDELVEEYVKKNIQDDGPRMQELLGQCLVETGLKDEDPALILGFLQITSRSSNDLKNLMRFVAKYKGAINFLDVEGVQNAINLACVGEVQKS